MERVNRNGGDAHCANVGAFQKRHHPKGGFTIVRRRKREEKTKRAALKIMSRKRPKPGPGCGSGRFKGGRRLKKRGVRVTHLVKRGRKGVQTRPNWKNEDRQNSGGKGKKKQAY